MTGRDPDASLVARAAAGDDVAVTELYLRHGPAALNAAKGVSTNAYDAEDAMSDAFVRVLEGLALHRVPVDVRFRPYLVTASRHAAVDAIRHSARCRPTDVQDELDRRDDGEQPGDRLVVESDAGLVIRAFQRLPSRWQTVLVLIEVERLSVKEAAMVVGLSPNATAQLAVRARAGLRRGFLRAGGGDDARRPA